MKVVCPCCSEQYKKTEFKVARKGDSGIEKQCPGCSKWLRPEPGMQRLKIIGFIVLLLASLLNFFLTAVDLRLLTSGIGFVGACLAFYAFRKEAFEPVEQ
jgi:hypothetical protein